ncbi:MAG: NUDIX domain-containing protein [Erysipelotrichaceae bacterium]|nr:NUDIX domain-containing protein [Erysipelotrichaceae bacterium]
MEILDITDEKGNPTGETIERSIAHLKGIRHRTAHIWIIRKNKDKYEFLLQKRSYDKDSFPGCYDTSSAGHIHAGDEPLESVLRELEEELGIKAQKEDLLFIGTYHIINHTSFKDKPFNDDEIPFVYVYLKDTDADSLVLQKEEIDSVKWFEMKDIERNLNPRNPEFCIPLDGFELVKQWVMNNL